jgi:hypothetical protein
MAAEADAGPRRFAGNRPDHGRGGEAPGRAQSRKFGPGGSGPRGFGPAASDARDYGPPGADQERPRQRPAKKNR